MIGVHAPSAAGMSGDHAEIEGVKMSTTIKADKGEKSFAVSVIFWTNDLTENEGEQIAKHAWTAGVVRVQANSAHGLRAQQPTPFHSLLELPAAIEQTLVKAGVKLHVGQMDKVMAYPDPAAPRARARAAERRKRRLAADESAGEAI
jgi:hypothetical protein